MLKSPHINFITLDRIATWKYPTAGNVLTGEHGRAVAIVCDECVAKRKEPKYAVEWDNDHTYVKYHEIEKLAKVGQGG